MQEHPETATGTTTATGVATDSTNSGNATASNASVSNQASATGNVTAAATAAPRKASLELVKELPRGSVGVVHQARNPQQDRFIARARNPKLAKLLIDRGAK